MTVLHKCFPFLYLFLTLQSRAGLLYLIPNMHINYIGFVFDLKLQLKYYVPSGHNFCVIFNVLYTFVKVLLVRADSRKLCLAYFSADTVYSSQF